jgi:hypothetical protein
MKSALRVEDDQGCPKMTKIPPKVPKMTKLGAGSSSA